MDDNSEGFSRRRFLATSGYTFVGSLALPTLAGPVRAQAPAAARLGDAHVHLFNLADLPARGFFEHAVMWNTQLDFWLLRPLWPAMLDMIAFLKSKTLTAAAELATYSFDPHASEDIGKAEFREISNRRVSNLARQSRIYQGVHRVEVTQPLSNAQQRLRDSYYQLGVWLAYGGEPIWRRWPGEAVERSILDDADIDRIRRGARYLHERSCAEAPGDSGNMGHVETIRYTLGWGRALMQSRQYHLRLYRDRIGAGKLRPSTVVNLLVDYDEWLGDGPTAGSDVEAQVAFWHRLSGDYAREEGIDIRTFAGFDPLKEVLEQARCRRTGASAAETTFARNCARWDARTIHGFKLYPPMGFRPIGNGASIFRGRRRARNVVRARLQECGVNWEDLPRLLDEALRRFYAFCSANGVPILAHAFHSNEASLCGGAHAGPSGWRDVAASADWRLRICLGHFAEGGDFVRAMRRHLDHRSVHRRNWPFHGTEQLLRQNEENRSRFFVDLGYMAEFLHEDDGRARAIAFFRALHEYCVLYDERCEHFMFGTDWIMLEREARSEKYVSNMLEGMEVARWPEQWRQNLLSQNLQQFLQPRPLG